MPLTTELIPIASVATLLSLAQPIETQIQCVELHLKLDEPLPLYGFGYFQFHSKSGTRHLLLLPINTVLATSIFHNLRTTLGIFSSFLSFLCWNQLGNATWHLMF